MKLEGVAYLPEPGECSETWDVPDYPLPLRVEFSVNQPIGNARLTKHEDGTITAVAEISDTLTPQAGVFLKQAPYFAIGAALKDGSYEGARVYGISVTRGNVNPLVPPYEKVEDEGEAEGS